MSRSVYSPGVAIEVLEEPLRRPDQRIPDPLHEAGMAQSDRGGRDPADDDDDHRDGEDPKPSPRCYRRGRRRCG